MRKLCSALALRKLLWEKPTKRFLFIGHADAKISPYDYTLGFTNPSGGLVTEIHLTWLTCSVRIRQALEAGLS